jgi:hypothetical protein
MAVVTPAPRIGKYAGGAMPSQSKSQQRLMRAAAHTKGGYGGVPQPVGRKYVAADKTASKRKLPQAVPRAQKSRVAPGMAAPGLINR